jgi:ATP-dependent DNA helicase RecQ
MNLEVQQILHRYWGTDNFRPGQQEAISAIIDKRDTLVVLPTGGGKSLCYQLPGLLLPGMCVVISPLIALMNDQVSALSKKGIRAMHISGPMSEDELVTALDNCRYGGFEFLYLSPERAQNPLVQERLAGMNLSVLAIDEAHCISEWGHDFRPAYREILQLKQLLVEVPTVAVTATATAQVQEDICQNLELQNPRRIVGSFDRPNISLHVLHTSNKLEAISEALHPKKSAAIVYVATRKNAESLSQHLNNMGHNTSYFHGGVDDKKKRIHDWMQEKTPVMVATTAFGMGIDKDNVARVVHATLPYSIEQYYQEIGRCGRDGHPAKATLLLDTSDDKKLVNRILSATPHEEVIKKTYKHLCHYFDIAYGELPETLKEFNLDMFCHRYALTPKTTFYVLEQLARGQVLTLTQYSSPKTKVQILNQHNQTDNPLVDYLMRHVGGITDRSQTIQLQDIARRSAIPLNNCIDTLRNLGENGTIALDQLHVDSAIQFHVPREDQQTLLPIVRELKHVKEEKERLAATVLAYVNCTSCLRSHLLGYFGEHASKNCANCSNCVVKEPAVNTLVNVLKRLLSQEETLSLSQLHHASGYSRQAVAQALDLMLQEEIIEQPAFNLFKRI